MRVVKFIKNNWLMTVTIILLLVLQALCVVEIPEYISKIIDVGIRTKGIEYATPIKIRASEIERMSYFLRDMDIMNNYNLVEIDGVKVYELKDGADVSKTNYEFARAMAAVEAIYRRDSLLESNSKYLDSLSKMFINMLKDDDTDMVFKKISRLHPNDLKLMNEVIDEKLELATDDVMLQIASSYLLKEYKVLGIDNIQAKYITTIIFKIIGIAFILFISGVVKVYLDSVYCTKFSEEMRNELYGILIGTNNASYNKVSSSSLINRTIYDAQLVETAISMLMRTVAYVPILVLGSFFKIMKLSDGFNLFLPTVVFICGVIGLSAFVILTPKNMKKRKMLDDINSVERDALNNLFIIRNSGKEKQQAKFEEVNTNIRNITVDLVETKYMSSVLAMVTINLAGVYLLWQGGIKINEGTLGIGALMAILDYLFQMAFVCIGLFKSVIDMISGFVSYSRCMEILKSKKKNGEAGKKIEKISKIEFRDVSFKYPGANEYIIKDFSLIINSGEKVSIYGKNSSGKTTLLNLLLKMYKVEEGTILVNDINIDEIDTDSLRKRIGVVMQESRLFEGNVKSNIMFGNEAVSNEDLNEIVKMTEIEDEYKENKKITYKGKNVSGGQKQRIAIARAVAMNPDVLVLDNAYSSLDEKTKKIIQDNIKRKFKDRMVIDIEKEKNMNLEYNHILEMKNE